MDAWAALGALLTLLIGGFVLGALAERLKQSAILGYLLAGMLLGPHGLHFVAQTDTVAVLAELGVALLLFSIGLEFSWGRLRRTGGRALAGGAVQVALSVALFVVVALVFGKDLRIAFVLGAALALSSTAYVLRILVNRAQLDSGFGRLSIAVLLVQDLAVVPLVLLTSVLTTGAGPWAALVSIGKLAGLAALMVGAFLVLFNVVVPRLLGTDVLRRNRELPLLLATASGLGSALAAHALGLSPAVGAFLAGMLLAESPFATQVRADVSALRTLLMTLFFGSIGMFGDPAVLAREAGPIGVAVLGVVAVKIGLVFVSLRFFGAPPRAALGAGFCLAQIGEFSFVVAGMARADLLGDRLFQLVVSTTIATLFATPFLTRAAPALVRRAAPAAGGPPPDGPAAAGAVLVVGFGPTGRAVAAALHARGDAVHVVDLNPDLVAAAEKAGYHAHVGDAAHPEVLEHVGVARAVAVAVAVPDPGAACAVTEQVRALAPCARVFVRARYSRELNMLKQAGAHVVVDEEEQVGRALAAALTDELARLGPGRTGPS